jgi:hypothetical protein
MYKVILLFLIIILIPKAIMAQNPYVGIQTSQRKGIISAMMNPAEMNNLSRTLEVQFFAGNAGIENNILSFSEALEYSDELWDKVMEKADRPVIGNTDGSVIIPSFGMKKGKWSFGLISQFQGRATVLNINPELGKYLSDNTITSEILRLAINNPNNQRANGVTWFESGIVVGREIWNNQKSKFSVGTNLKLLFPTGFTNVGVSELNGTLVVNNGEVSLTNAQGSVNFSFSEEVLDFQNFNIDYSNLGFGNLNGFGFDLGVNYQLKNNEGVWFNTGLAIRNVGSLTFGKGQNNQTFQMAIPEGESFRIDLLEPDFRSIESDFLSSGYFTRESNRDGFKASLPTVLAANADLKLTEIFFVSVYGQTFVQNKENNLQVPAISLIALTPSAVFGRFEVYSPWGYYDVVGFTGGLGLRFGGFFVGSQSVLTALISDTKKADIQIGLSWGFGKRANGDF